MAFFMISVVIIVKGTVQGVAFRHHTKLKAKEIGIYGSVKNQPDGSVMIIATSSNEKINQLIDWARNGSPASSVKELFIEYLPNTPSTTTEFQIIR